MIGAHITPTGTPALASVSISLNRRSGEGVHGSIARAVELSQNARLTLMPNRACAASARNSSMSRSTSALFEITETGFRYARQTSRQRRVSSSSFSTG